MSGKCPFGGDRIGGASGTPPTLSDWYPDRLKVELLHKNGPQANPLGDEFDYAEAFNNRGIVLQAIGRRTDAVAAFRAFIAAAKGR